MPRRRDTGDTDASGGDRPAKKARKQRPCFSCEECRRLKMKCDRQVPCSNCIRRQRLPYCTRISDDAPATPRDTPRATPHAKAVSEPATSRVAPAAPGATPFLPFGENNAYLSSAPPTVSHAVPSSASATATATAAPGLSPARSLTLHSIPALPAHHLGLPPDDARDEPDEPDDEEKSNAYGTLVISRGGRSKYLGPTAGSEWLKDSQLHDTANTTSITRCPSPEPGFPSAPDTAVSKTSQIAFPMNASAAQIRTRDLLARLPPADEAWSLVESYYRYCAWHHDVAPRERFKETFARVYAFTERKVNFQELALVFMIMSKGTVYNIEMPTDDPSAEEWQHLSEMALCKGNFLSNNTIAGVQTLHIMAHKNFQSDKGRHDDKAWLLWGLAMRMIQAMGLHRDGARWNLSSEVVEERRKVFWEVNAADIFQAHCFSRPATMNPDHCDTEFPTETNKAVPNEKGYYELRFELSQLSHEILIMAMKARRPPYTDVAGLDQKLRAYEQAIPYYMRCRAALTAMVSRYPHADDAAAASPPPSRHAMTLAFQQANLALNTSETVINLHRPYYAKALYDDDPDRSVYAPSLYSVIERCAAILALIADIHSRFPAISTRQWNFWYHVFGSALCLGTLVLRHPAHAMASFALLQIDLSIHLFASLVQNGAGTPRYQRNLQWLQRLRTRAAEKMAQHDKRPPADASASTSASASANTSASTSASHAAPAAAASDDGELVGWRTRLLRQADQQQTATADAQTVATETTPTNFDYAPGSNGSLQSTDDVLREFWDPIMIHDLLEGSTMHPGPGPGTGTGSEQFTPMATGPSWWEYGGSGPRASMGL